MMAYHEHLASHQSFWFHCMVNLVEHVFDPRILYLIFDTKMVFSHGLWSGCYYWNMIAVDIVSTQTDTRYWLNNTPTKSCLQSIRSTFSAIHHLFWFQSFYTISTNMQSYWNICIINFSGVSISSSQTSNFSLMYALCNFIHLGFLEATDFATLRLSIAWFFYEISPLSVFTVTVVSAPNDFLNYKLTSNTDVQHRMCIKSLGWTRVAYLHRYHTHADYIWPRSCRSKTHWLNICSYDCAWIIAILSIVLFFSSYTFWSLNPSYIYSSLHYDHLIYCHSNHGRTCSNRVYLNNILLQSLTVCDMNKPQSCKDNERRHTWKFFIRRFISSTLFFEPWPYLIA